MLRKDHHRCRFLSIGLVVAVIWSLSGFSPANAPLWAVTDQKPLKITAQLYFATADQTFLTVEDRVLTYENDPADLGKAVIGALIDGPQQDLMRTLPKETVLKGIYITEDGTAYVDFSNAIREHHPGGCGMEWLSVFSVVNSLILNIDQIKAVKILIGGREAKTLAGHIDLRFPFSANMLITR